MSTPYDARPWLKYYSPGVPPEVDVPEVPLTRLLDNVARQHPRHTALIFLGSKITYRELRQSVDRFALGLRKLGVDKGDRVAVILPNCPQEVIAFFAILRLGAIVVLHNPLYTVSELHHQLVDCGAKVAITFDRVYEKLTAARRGSRLEHVIVTSLIDYLPATKRLALRLPLEKARELRGELTVELPHDAEVHWFDDLLTTKRRRVRQAHVNPDRDLALLQYTGGTTGRPKGAMLTHRNLVANAYQTRAWDPRAEEVKEVSLAVLPLFHVFGLTTCLLTGVLLGGTLVLLPKYDLEMTLKAIKKWKPTLFFGVPPIYTQIIESPDLRKYNLRSIRTCISGAMRLPRETVERFQEAAGGHLVQGYGLTETSPVAIANPLAGNARHVTVGIPMSSTEARIVDENDANLIKPVGEAGELLIRGPQVFRGYWNQPEETADVLHFGWIRTGDVAMMSPDGYFTLIDRKRDVIMVSGFSVFPSEIEDVILEHPAVKDCAVIGVPDQYRGENVKAYVILSPGHDLTTEELKEHCARYLVAYKVPRLVEVREDLPRNMLGKVLRRVLREEHGAHSLSTLG
ncbi:MAG: AMP-binding protein [Streptosporangiales bacterium]|nr:AMP-binding protein [Streptosporangiales bacterium]